MHPNPKQWLKFGREVSRIVVIVTCCAGFAYQTMQFLKLYWTYPTVVDIQTTAPTYLDVPAITICNPIGYNYTSFCHNMPLQYCGIMDKNLIAKLMVCGVFPSVCVDGRVPPGSRIIQYTLFLKTIKIITGELLENWRMKLEDYVNCTIHFARSVRRCNMDNVIGSYFTRDALPQFCYTIYSVWGNINKTRERIPKGAVMKLDFKLNASRRVENFVPDFSDVWTPVQKLPTNPYVQIAVHSPYFLPSPYLEGSSYKGGKSYELGIAMNENHLLPSPYQSNCMDYMKTWKESGGRGPINQLTVIQECRMQRWHSVVGCVPVTVDYPHPYGICGSIVANDPDSEKRLAFPNNANL